MTSLHGNAKRIASYLSRISSYLQRFLLIRPDGCVFHLLRKYLDIGPAGLILP
jgi:hypothetical protein